MTEQTEQALLAELAERCGIAPDYYDVMGRRHDTSAETQRAILRAMGVATGTVEELRRELLRREEEPWHRACDPVQVQPIERSGSWSFCMPVPEGLDQEVEIEWELQDEAGAVWQTGKAGPGLVPVEHRMIGGHRRARFDLPIPSGLVIGYYSLRACGRTPEQVVEGALRLIIVPSRCYAPSWFDHAGRIWGLAVQLYALRSSRDWGVGDFSDLSALVEWAARDLGAGLVGLNPLHALKNSRPYHISPYSPDSRLYLNVLYVDVERVPELKHAEAAQRLLKDNVFRSKLDALRKSDLVDYDQVYAAKLAVLDLGFAAFETQPKTAKRRQAFERFIQKEGESLEWFAVFQALSNEMRERYPHAQVWRDWPEPYRSPASPAVAAFRTTHGSRIRFHMYLQWVAAEQLGEAAGRARAAGMPIGLYHDLAVGNDRAGSDAWVFQDVLVLDADCGAPPDLLGPEGQNWGLPPVDPAKLRASGYRLFIDLLRKNMRYGGALRLDHVMALFRLFWVPRGLPASAGAYVRYPADDLLGILALESLRHRVVVVGEDLGTVPDVIREQLAAHGVLSYRVLYFERTADGGFLPPSCYPVQATAVVTTHDLPTLAGFWTGDDIELRAKLGLYPDEARRRLAVEERRRDKAGLLEALKAESLLPEEPHDGAMTPALCHAIHAYLGRTPCRLMLATLEDVVGERAQVNVPGTVESHHNWSRKTPLSVEELGYDEQPRQLAKVLQQLRPVPPV